MHGSDRRSHTRRDALVVASFDDGTRGPVSGLATNLSRSGLLLRSRRCPEVGRMLMLDLRFPMGACSVFGRVVRSHGTTAAVWLDELLPEAIVPA